MRFFQTSRYISIFFLFKLRPTVQRLILVVINICLILNSCSRSVLKNRDKTDGIGVLTQKAIIEYLEQPDVFLGQLTGKGLTKLDPLLCSRETLRINGMVYFDEPMRSDLLKYPLPKKTYRLNIPDSLTGKFRYTDEDKDYEHDYSIIHQFSPLLPTKDPDIFLMEHYIWANSCGDVRCVRALNRDYLKFSVQNQKITILEGVTLTNVTDFIGFGAFSRKKMEEALPGEKITKFGW